MTSNPLISLSRIVVCSLGLVGLLTFSPATSGNGPDGPAETQTATATVNLRDFGAVGDGVANDGPALQAALNSLASSGGGTVYVPAGRYALITPVNTDFSGLAGSIVMHGEPSTSPIDLPGNGSGLNLQSEFIIKVGPANDALAIRRINGFTIKDISFIGDQTVTTDARRVVLFDEVGTATIDHSEFYGLASLVSGGAIVLSYRGSLKIDKVAFLGCSTNSAHNASMVETQEWKAISVSNTKFIDYGNRAGFFSKTPLAPPYSWIGIGNAAALQPNSLQRHALIETVKLDEGAFIGISSIPARYAPVSVPFGIYISDLFMNVTNLGASGNYFAGVKRVFIEKSHYGWSHNATGAISLNNINESILDLVTCVLSADRIHADAATQRLVVMNSLYGTLNSQAPYTRVITTTDPMDDPVQYVRQQFMDVLGQQPSLPSLYYWADRLLKCEDSTPCLTAKRAELATYLSATPASEFMLTGRMTSTDGSPIAGVSVELTGSTTAVTQTDSNGNYSFGPLLTSGEYTLTPSKNLFTFFSQSVINPTSNRVVNFTGFPSPHTISGSITNQFGEPVGGAQVALSGTQTRTITTSPTGQYSFVQLIDGGNFTVTVSRPNYTFATPTKSVTNLSADHTFDFLGTLGSHSVGGKVRSLSGVPITGASVSVAGTESHTTTTDANGYYSFAALRAEGNYTVSVSAPPNVFLPETRQVNNLVANQTANFDGVATHTISGKVSRETGGGLPGVTVTLSGSLLRVTTTNDQGDYSFTVGMGGNYVVTPSKLHYGLSPTIATFSNVTANQTANFTATAVDTVVFSSVNYSVAEGDDVIDITVTRAGDVSGEARVKYSLTDGTALQTQDYTLAAGVLNFEPLETTKTFQVLITNDAYIELPQETVNLLLTDPTGFVLGNMSSAVLTIVDTPNPPPSTNPIEDARTFVDQQYDDFLGRSPDQAGLDYWTNQISQCGTDQSCIQARRIGVSAAFFVESEFQQSGGFVYRVIKSMTGQRPDYFAFMEDRGYMLSFSNVDTGKQTFVDEYVTRPEFITEFPLLLPKAEFIDRLIAKVRGNTGVDLTSQRDFLLSEYNLNDSRGQILRLIADDQTLRNAEFNRAFVLMQYFGYLRRNPDQNGYDFWLNAMNQNSGNHRAMVCAFLTSAEFQQRFSAFVPWTNQSCVGVQ